MRRVNPWEAPGTPLLGSACFWLLGFQGGLNRSWVAVGQGLAPTARSQGAACGSVSDRENCRTSMPSSILGVTVSFAPCLLTTEASHLFQPFLCFQRDFEPNFHSPTIVRIVLQKQRLWDVGWDLPHPVGAAS